MSTFTSSNRQRWSSRVYIVTAIGRVVRHVSGEHASKMVASGEAHIAIPPKSKRERIHQIVLARTPINSSRKRPPTEPAPWMYSGQRYIYREVLDDHHHSALAFKHIPKCDLWSLNMAVSDTRV